MNAEMARAEDERAARDAEIAADENYANAVNGLAACLRLEMARERHGFASSRYHRFAALLRAVAADIEYGQSGNQTLAVFDDWGPGAVCIALKRAVDEPQPEEP